MSSPALNPSKAPIDPSVLQNRIAVSLAQKRKLISSWLPPPTPQEVAEIRNDEEALREESKIWTARPATLGVGHPIPPVDKTTTANGFNREDEALRRRILGPHAAKEARLRHLERTKRNDGGGGIDSESSDNSQDDFDGRVSTVALSRKEKRKRAVHKGSVVNNDEDAASTGNSTKKKGGGDGEIENAADLDTGFISLPVKQSVSVKKRKKQKKQDDTSKIQSTLVDVSTNVRTADPSSNDQAQDTISSEAEVHGMDSSEKKNRRSKKKNKKKAVIS